MDSCRSNEEREILNTVRQVVDECIAPRAAVVDSTGQYPTENFADLHRARLIGMAVRKEFGGLGCGLHGNVLVEIMAVEELARGCSSTAQVFHNHNGCIGILYYLASAGQQQRFSREIASDGAMHVIWGGETGKTVYDIRTKARRVDGGYLINGTKVFSSGSGGARWFQLAAVVEGKSLAEGMLIPMVRRDNPGLTIGNDWDAMGQRGTASGTTTFKDCFVPDEDVLGAPGDYYKLLLFGPYFQLGWAALYVGLARGALDTGIDYVRTHTRPWADAGIERAVEDPYIRGHVADMSVKVEAARLLLYAAARALEHAHLHPETRPEAAVAVYRAKVMATEVALDVTARIFQVMGARGRQAHQQFRSLLAQRADVYAARPRGLEAAHHRRLAARSHGTRSRLVLGEHQMNKQFHLNGFTQCCINHHSEGQWKHPLDGSSRGYRDIDYWVDLARLLERGGFTCLFLADVHGTYSVYQGSRDTAVRHAVQFPSNEPTVIIPAMAAATRTLGFAATFSTTYFPPYQTAKLFSTLDHLTRGRVGWNIVTSYLADANANMGITEELGHDERYDRAEEYMEVVYKLWEHSWEENAVVRDTARDVFAEPARVHQIDHEGRWYKVPGPHMCEPSRQRTPLLFQAGQSGRGTDFAARHAEAIFCVHANIETSARGVSKIRAAIAAAGREPGDVKICQGVSVVVAPTDEEARLKLDTCRRYTSPEGSLALFSGWAGIDLSTIRPDQPLDTMDSNAIQGLLSYFRDADPDRRWTVREMGEWISLGSIMPKFVGSPTTVADELERWVDETGVDGFNLVPIIQPAGFRDFVDLVVPELRHRGRLPPLTAGNTLREHYFGPGRPRLPANHVAQRTLPPWKA